MLDTLFHLVKEGTQTVLTTLRSHAFEVEIRASQTVKDLCGILLTVLFSVEVIVVAAFGLRWLRLRVASKES